jgi:enoyl-CoA hydratase
MIDIVLDGPGKNALSSEMLAFLRARLDAAGGAPVRLTGAGDTFSAGLHLTEVAAFSAEAMATFLTNLDAHCAALYDYPGPTVAYMNGHAIAGGCVLALCCDYRVVADRDRIRIGLNEVALGVRFPPAILRIVMDRLPLRHRAEILLGAGLFGPADALRLGLVDEVAADADAASRARLEALAAHPAEAYAATKADIRRGVTAVSDEARRHFLEAVLPIWTSDRTRARIRAVLGR